MNFGKMRRTLRRADRLLGDANAVNRGRIPQRASNRIIGRTLGRLTRKLWR